MRRFTLAAFGLVCILMRLPAAAGAAADDIPGTPISLGAAVSGIVDEDTKPNDVYSITLTRGEEVSFTLNASKDLDGSYRYLVLLSPSSISVVDNHYSEVAEPSTHTARSPTITYMPAVNGTYPVGIWAHEHGLAYSLAVAGSAEKPLYRSSFFIRTSKTSVKRGGSVTISGSLADQNLNPFRGKGVVLQRSYDGETWTTMHALNADSGRYSATVSLIKSTWFRTSFAGDADNAACTSRKLLVKTK